MLCNPTRANELVSTNRETGSYCHSLFSPADFTGALSVVGNLLTKTEADHRTSNVREVSGLVTRLSCWCSKLLRPPVRMAPPPLFGLMAVLHILKANPLSSKPSSLSYLHGPSYVTAHISTVTDSPPLYGVPLCQNASPILPSTFSTCCLSCCCRRPIHQSSCVRGNGRF